MRESEVVGATEATRGRLLPALFLLGVGAVLLVLLVLGDSSKTVSVTGQQTSDFAEVVSSNQATWVWLPIPATANKEPYTLVWLKSTDLMGHTPALTPALVTACRATLPQPVSIPYYSTSAPDIARMPIVVHSACPKGLHRWAMSNIGAPGQWGRRVVAIQLAFNSSYRIIPDVQPS